MSVIKLNYDLAIAQAMELEKISRESREAAAKIRVQRDTIADYWTGLAANAAFEEFSELLKQVEGIAEACAIAAKEIRMKADYLRAVDEEEAKTP